MYTLCCGPSVFTPSPLSQLDGTGRLLNICMIRGSAQGEFKTMCIHCLELHAHMHMHMHMHICQHLVTHLVHTHAHAHVHVACESVGVLPRSPISNITENELTGKPAQPLTIKVGGPLRSAETQRNVVTQQYLRMLLNTRSQDKQ